MFQPLKGYLQGVQLIYSSSVGQLHIKLNFTTGDSFCWPTLLECMNYTLKMNL